MFVLSLLVALQLAQSVPPRVVPENTSALIPGLGSPTVAIPRIDATIQSDGRLDEPVWSQASRLGGFWQYQPIDGRPAVEQTEVLVWYSPTAIHFGILAYDHDPSSIRATLPDRDHLDSEDTVTIYLDTFCDRRRAFFFTVNPLGVQQDGMHSEAGFNAGTMSGGGMDDKNPDFLFASKGRVTEDGYVVEVLIPFKTLRYPAGSAPQKWGLQIRRIVQRTGYKDTWTDARKAGESFLAQSGTIERLHDLERGIVTEIQPVITAAENGSRSAVGAPFVRDKADIKPGANLRFSTSNLTFDSTINPDFSQVEADAAQVIVNERFALNYPEKRPFFLEGIDIFATPNQLVYTRQIVDPIVGEKVTGKLGPLNVAYMVMKEKKDSGGAFSNIARVRHDFGYNSTLGLTFTSRSTAGESNQVFAIDERTIFNKLYYVQFQAARSWTQTQSGQHLSSSLWMAELDRTGRAFGINYKLIGTGTNFLARSGYIARNDVVQAQMFNRYSWYFSKGAWLETLQVHLNLTRFWRYNEFGNSGALEGTDAFVLQSGWRNGWTLNATLNHVFWRLEPDMYSAYQVCRDGEPTPYLPTPRIEGWTTDIVFKTPILRAFDGQIEVKRGPVLIFAEGSPGHETRITSTLNGRPTGSIRAQVMLTYSRITRDRDGTEFARSVIPWLKLEYQMTRSIFFRVVGQYQSKRQGLLFDPIEGNPLAIDGVLPVATNSNGLRLDWLVSFKPTPFIVAFFGYGSSLVTDRTLSLANLNRMSDGFFMKIAYQIGR